MKTYLSIILASLLFIPCSMEGQKIRKESAGKIKYIQPKANQTLEGSEKYHLKVLLSNYDASRKDCVMRTLHFKNYVRTDDIGSADFEVVLEENKLGFVNPNLRKTRKKYKEEGVTKYRTRYQYRGKALYKYTLRVMKNGIEVSTITIEDEEPVRPMKQESQEMAMECYQKLEAIKDMRILENVIDKMEEQFADIHHDLVKQVSIKTLNVKSKSSSSTDFSNALTKLSSALEVRNSRYKNDNKNLELIMESIEIFEKIIQNASFKEKKTRYNTNLAAASHFNAGVGYFLLGDFAKSVRHLEQSKKRADRDPHHEKLLEMAVQCSNRIENLAAK